MMQDSQGPLERDITRVGFVGIGNMGQPMAAHLIKAGWDVQVFDLDAQKVHSFVEAHGGSGAEGLQTLAARSDVIITMLPDGHVVRRVVLDTAEGLVSGLRRGALLIDMSSSAPMGTRELGASLSAVGVGLVDAPVSGGVRGAVAASLAIMVGGEAPLAKRVDPLLAPMGRRFYVGALGAGHAAKVLNNYVSAAGLAAAGEAVLIARRFGIDPQTIINVINASTGRNNSTENKFAQFILNRTFNSGFSLGLMSKDIALAMEVAKACGVDAQLGHACLELWQDAEAKLGPGADHTEVVRHLGEV